MALSAKAETDRIIQAALGGEYPPDGVYENDDARLSVDCGGAWINFAWKKAIPYSVMLDCIENGEIELL